MAINVPTSAVEQSRGRRCGNLNATLCCTPALCTTRSRRTPGAAAWVAVPRQLSVGRQFAASHHLALPRARHTLRSKWQLLKNYSIGNTRPAVCITFRLLLLQEAVAFKLAPAIRMPKQALAQSRSELCTGADTLMYVIGVIPGCDYLLVSFVSVCSEVVAQASLHVQTSAPCCLLPVAKLNILHLAILSDRLHMHMQERARCGSLGLAAW